MDDFTYQPIARGGGSTPVLHAEDLPIDDLADALGTPLFVYSKSTIVRQYGALADAFAPLRPRICYAVKANGNMHLLRLLASMGSGMDVVSGIELERAWAAGCPLSRVTFAGVGKTEPELRAALTGSADLLGLRRQELGLPDPADRQPVGMVNVESGGELELLESLAAEYSVRPKVAVRVNPDIDAHTHTYTTTGRKSDKFGVAPDAALELFARFGGSRHVDVCGLHVHLGSPIYTPETFAAGTRALLDLADRIHATTGNAVSHLDLGGGYGTDYQTGQSPPISAYAQAMIPLLRDRVADGLSISMEPGRCIVGNAGVLVTTVQYTKQAAGRQIAVCDAGMTSLIRPALYGAFHFAWPTRPGADAVPARRAEKPDLPGLVPTNVVGPVCESSDFLATDRPMPVVKRGDRIAVFTAGAYGMSMASTYNDHPYPAEVLVDGGSASVIRERQDAVELLRPTAGEARAVSLAKAGRSSMGAPA